MQKRFKYLILYLFLKTFIVLNDKDHLHFLFRDTTLIEQKISTLLAPLARHVNLGPKGTAQRKKTLSACRRLLQHKHRKYQLVLCLGKSRWCKISLQVNIDVLITMDRAFMISNYNSQIVISRFYPNLFAGYFVTSGHVIYP
jgi:hypothetical protein